MSFWKSQFPTFAGWAGNLGWPILLRQLRADFRKNRFFLSQLICLSLIGIALIVVISTKVDDRRLTAPQIGQSLFSLFVRLEYWIILLVFPAFSATSFTEERSNASLDLLLATTLKPAEIVWGKFFASTAYCLMFVLASVPLLSIAFLFGGIRLTEVVAAYAMLLGLTLLVSMLGVCVSSLFSTNVRATLTTYALMAIPIGLSVPLQADPAASLPLIEAPTAFDALLRWLDPGSGQHAFRTALACFLAVSAFSYLFLITANRIRPASDDKSSALRALTFVTVLGILGADAWSSFRSGRPWGQCAHAVIWIQRTAALLWIVALVFPTEEAAVSRRNRRRFGRWDGRWWPLKIFAPGAFWGLLYTVFLAFAVCGTFLVAWETGVSADTATHSCAIIIRESLMILPLYISAIGALGFLLSALGFTPFYSRLTVFFSFLITCLLPVIFMVSRQKDALWTLYFLSPITLWSSLQARPPDAEPRFVLLGVEACDMAKVVFGALAIGFFLGGVLASRRAHHPLWTLSRLPSARS